MSPLLFLLEVKDEVARCAVQEKLRGIIRNPLKPSGRLQCLDYVDDKHIEMLTCKGKLSDLGTASAKVGLRINVKNTVEIWINPERKYIQASE